jgi:hypothetical protein
MGTGGGPIASPWLWEAGDYLGRKIRITVDFNNATQALTGATIHRDTGCLFTKIVFDNPSDEVKSKRLAAPTDGQPDNTYTKNQLNAQGLTTVADLNAVQCTAER